ncbi:hypothetical protein [Lutispora saccharofermentans]|uniref:Uncharacterized protein n=1 Tax=Lutispora saccharofermentans TaxID=3024236 RepID=A0ABT1NAZ1_9FIRM|nr:hypothetical protein [Lutispora saccharofermentans]MCQ1528433.1 hypothetical protein [Lutispora saccharofermentans]
MKNAISKFSIEVYKSAAIVIILVLAIILHISIFQIQEEQLVEIIAQNVSATEGMSYDKHDIIRRRQLDFDFRKIIVYSFPSANGSEIVGFANFYKGLTNKYAVQTIAHKRQFVYAYVIEGLKDKYLILTGKNYNRNIDSIEITKDDGSKYIQDISREEYFIFKVNVSSLKNCRLLDKEGKELSRDFDFIYIEEKMED